MLPFRLVYSAGYDLNLGRHVFPSQKYRLIRDSLMESGIADPEDFEEPEPASDEDILLVHEPGWVERLKNGTLSVPELVRLEIPYSEQMVKAVWLATGGSILAAKNALRDGIGFNLGGGFHHAFPSYGEGFCAIHDFAVAIRRLQKDMLIERAMVVDCDVHHGNGTAAIFAGDPSVLTLSIHQYDNYPDIKPPSTIDIHLADRAGDAEYLERLSEGCTRALEAFHPDLICYVAGADPYHADQLGGLALSMAGLQRRDRLVFEMAKDVGAPVLVLPAGGYARQVGDTVTIHANTVRAALS